MRSTAAVLLAILSLAACSEETAGSQPGRSRPVVYTTLYPVHYFAQRIAGERVEARCAIPASADPLHWLPDRATIEAMQAADMLVLSGAGAEPWMFSVSLPQARVVEAAKELHDHFLEIENAVTHSHGTGGTHTHHGVDPHLWMDPLLAKAQARAIAAGLILLVPAAKAELEGNLRALERDLDGLHERFAALGPQPEREVLVAAHAAYDYLAKRYGWRMLNLDLDPGAALGEADLAAVRARLHNVRARVILWGEPPIPQLAAQIEALGLRGIVCEPCERLPAAGAPDYAAAMRANIERLAAVWR
jgi:zinc transport system substrate-binding protein